MSLGPGQGTERSTLRLLLCDLKGKICGGRGEGRLNAGDVSVGKRPRMLVTLHGPAPKHAL